MKNTIISFDNYYFRYFLRDKLTLTGLTFSITEGEFVVITGASGSGKSTIIYSMLGLIPFFYLGEIKGNVSYRNRNITDFELSELSKHIGYIPQRIDNSFVTPYVFSELAFPLEYSRKYNKKEICTKLVSHTSKINIQQFLTRKINELSEGEKQLVSFGCATVNDPEVILADEPLANLDYKNKERILTKLKQFHDSGKTIIIATHEYETYLPIATRFINITEGSIKEDTQIRNQERKIMKKEFEQEFPKRKGGIIQQSNNIAIKVENLNFSYTNQFHLKDISFSIQRGQNVGIIGDNGSGKTTLLKILCGLLKPQSGNIRIYGEVISKLSWNKITKKIGLVLQDPDKQFFEETVNDEVTLISNNLKYKYNEKEITQSLIECNLEKYRGYNPHSLSFGEKKRLTFLASKQHQPDILLIDEITVGMDIKNKEWAIHEISKFKTEGKTTLIASHDWLWLNQIADTIIYMKDGQIHSILDVKSFNKLIMKKNIEWER